MARKTRLLRDVIADQQKREQESAAKVNLLNEELATMRFRYGVLKDLFNRQHKALVAKHREINDLIVKGR